MSDTPRKPLRAWKKKYGGECEDLDVGPIGLTVWRKPGSGAWLWSSYCGELPGGEAGTKDAAKIAAEDGLRAILEEEFAILNGETE